MRKFISVLFALVLVASFSLVTAVPAAAEPDVLNVIPFTLEDEENATAVWTDVAYSGGVWSVKMERDDSGSFAKIVTSLSMPIDDLDSVSFKFNVNGALSPWAERTNVGSISGNDIPKTYDTPYAVLVLDDASVLVHNNHRVLSNADTWQTWPDAGDLAANPGNTEWPWYPECNQWTKHGGTYTEETKTLEQWKAVLDLRITQLKIDFGGMPWEPASEAYIEEAASIWAYVDDIDINGVTYELEYAAYTSIQDAIDAANPGGGDTISVAAGTYNEVVTIDKSLTLNGAKAGQDARTRTFTGESILDGTGIDPEAAYPYSTGITIGDAVSDVVIDGFEITNFTRHPIDGGYGSGILVWRDTTGGETGANANIIIQNNYLHDLGWNGVCVGTGGNGLIQTGLTIQFNLIEEAPYAGIELTNTSSSTVEDNKIIAPTVIVDDPGDAGVGIEIAVRSHTGITISAGSVLVEGNEITGTFAGGSRAAINILSRTYSSTSDATLTGVTVRSNTISASVPDSPAILADAESRDGGPAAITNLAILDNPITSFSKAGVVVKNVASVQIEENVISLTDHSLAPNGIQVGYVMDSTATTGTVKGNQVSGCSWEDYDPGRAYEATGPINWTGSGILVIAPNSALEISGNEVQSCDVGLDIETGSDTFIEDNDVHDNSYGFVLWNDDPTINYNNIYQNALGGVYRTTEGSLEGIVDAENNWWGAANGPSGEGSGDGDAVSTDVDYSPWLGAEYPEGEATYPATINGVGYDTIQAAVTAASANDTITVSPGTYVGNITVSEDVTLSAPDGAKLEGTGGSVVFIGDYTVTLEGFEIDPGTDGIEIPLISAGNVVTIVGEVIHDNSEQGIDVGQVYGTLNVLGCDIYENDWNGIYIELVGDGGAVNILNSRIHDNTDEGIYICEVYGYGTSVTIEDNFIAQNLDGGIYHEVSYEGSSTTIRGNAIVSNGIEDGNGGIYVCGEGTVYGDSSYTVEYNLIAGNWGNGVFICEVVDSSLTIRGNTIGAGTRDGMSFAGNNGCGIFIWDVDSSNAEISRNTIAENTEKGIAIPDVYNDGSVDIINNNILENGHSGIAIFSVYADGSVDIYANNIVGSNNKGVLYMYSSSDEYVDATSNWWGDASGPSDQGPGTGDKVSTYVHFTPWLTSPAVWEIKAKLGPGWNTFSTPIALDSATDQLAELPLDMEIAFGFSNGEWVLITIDNDKLVPCEAFYVKMNSRAIILLAPSPGRSDPPTTALSQGWNLVGLANLGPMAADEALTSAFLVPGDLTGYDQVVSPSGNMGSWSYVRAGEDAPDMLPTEGYWVFMKNAGTLAGFTFTPISLGP